MLTINKKNMLNLASYRKELYKNPKLKFLFFELTDKCNLNCVHCGSNCNSKRNNFLDINIIKKTLDEVSKMYDSKRIMVCLTGGEPLLYDDIYEVMNYSKKKKYLVGITSNGTLVDNHVAEKLVKSGLDSIAISIDGLKDTHDNLRQCKGVFEKAFDGIRSLKKAGIEPNVTTVINKNSFGEIESLYNLMKNENINSWRIINVEPIGRARASKELLLDKNEILKLFDFIKEKRFNENNDIDVTYGCSHFVTFKYEKFVRDFYFQCLAGTQVASIAANGDIVACLDIERRNDLVQGNIYKDSFIDVWENKYETFRKDWSDNSKLCNSCEYKKVCMGDSAHTWDYDNDAPMYCIKNI